MKRFLAVVLIAVYCTSYAQIPVQNLEAYYPFSGNANDHSGKMLHGTVSGAMLTTDRGNLPDSAYQFDGANDYILVPDPPGGELDFELNGSFTIVVWIKTTASSEQQVIMKRRMTGGAFNEGYLIRTTPSGNINFEIEDVNGTFTSLNSVTVINDNEWHSVAAVRDVAGDEIRLYIDGQLDLPAQPDGSSSTLETNADFIIGYHPYYGLYMDGKIDDIRVYSSVLADCDIYSTYLEGLKLHTKEFIEICNLGSYTFPDGTSQTNIKQNLAYTSSFPSLLTGCDSASIETNISVFVIRDTVIEYRDTLESLAGLGATYQWVKCSDNYSPISGETNPVFSPVDNGSFGVIISQNGCTDTSICYAFTTIGAEEQQGNGFRIYPNPTEGQVTLEAKGSFSPLQYKLFSILGQEIAGGSMVQGIKHLITLPEPAGVYFLQVSGTEYNEVHRIVKK